VAKSTNILDYAFAPTKKLTKGQPVTISRYGLKEHIEHHKFGQMFAGAGLAAFALGTSGLGFGVVGSLGAFGVGAAELAAVGAIGGACAGAALNKSLNITGHARFNDVDVVPMVGFVKCFDTHWADSSCKLVKITWYYHDENGVLRTQDEYHQPRHIYGLIDRAEAEAMPKVSKEDQGLVDFFSTGEMTNPLSSFDQDNVWPKAMASLASVMGRLPGTVRVKPQRGFTRIYETGTEPPLVYA